MLLLMELGQVKYGADSQRLLGWSIRGCLRRYLRMVRYCDLACGAKEQSKVRPVIVTVRLLAIPSSDDGFQTSMQMRLRITGQQALVAYEERLGPRLPKLSQVR